MEHVCTGEAVRIHRWNKLSFVLPNRFIILHCIAPYGSFAGTLLASPCLSQTLQEWDLVRNQQLTAHRMLLPDDGGCCPWLRDNNLGVAKVSELWDYSRTDGTLPDTFPLYRTRFATREIQGKVVISCMDIVHGDHQHLMGVILIRELPDNRGSRVLVPKPVASVFSCHYVRK